MKTRNYLIPLLLTLALAAIGAWVATNLEWTHTQVRTPAQGEARGNPYYVVQRLLSTLGGTVVKRDGLDALPPPHARLILADANWDVLPGRQQQLKTWVAQGGHLIIPSRFLDQKTTQDWLPVTWEKEPDDDDAADGEGRAASGTPASGPAARPAGGASDGSTDKSANQPAGASADAASGAASDEPADAASGAASDKPADAASGASSDEQADAASATSSARPAARPAASPSATPARAASRASAPHPESATNEDEDEDCHPVAEPQGTPAWYLGHRDYVACFYTRPPHVVPKGADKPLWQVVGTDDSSDDADADADADADEAKKANRAARPRGAEIIRMRYGQGTITVIDGWSLVTWQDDARALPGDNALLLAAALQARRGAAFWFVTETSDAGGSKDAGLLTWLWRHGGTALALALFTLALAVWRSAVRFGPIARPASIDRRSMADQVRGTGRFLRARGGEALHAAQLRALHEAAAPRIARYATRDANARATAIAAATKLAPAALARAMEARPRKPAELAPDLELLETARRRLLAGTIADANDASTDAGRSGSASAPASSPPSSS